MEDSLVNAVFSWARLIDMKSKYGLKSLGLFLKCESMRIERTLGWNGCFQHFLWHFKSSQRLLGDMFRDKNKNKKTMHEYFIIRTRTLPLMGEASNRLALISVAQCYVLASALTRKHTVINTTSHKALTSNCMYLKRSFFWANVFMYSWSLLLCMKLG